MNNDELRNEQRKKQIERRNALEKRAKELLEQGYTCSEVANFLKLKESSIRALVAKE